MKIPNNKLTLGVVLQRFIAIHGNDYDYSKVEYISSEEKVQILCKQCKKYFYQAPYKHWNGQGCPYCAKTANRLTTKEFITRCRKVHGNKYNYDKAIYINSNKKILIHCNQCNRDFWQLPSSHLRGHGCKWCIKEIHKNNRTITKKEWLHRFKAIHKDKYTYLDIPLGIKNKITIQCNTCGNIFKQGKQIHESGCGCPVCNKTTITKEKFINKVECVHNHSYEYNLNEYTKADEYINIKCKRCNRIFKQKAAKHLQGQGCPYCNQSKGETAIARYLNQHKIKFKIQHRFNDCRDKRPLPFDFYLPNHNICIEYQGEQHYNYKLFLGLYKDKKRAHEAFKLQQKHDKIKRNFCKNNQIYLLEIKYNEKLETKLKKFLKIE